MSPQYWGSCAIIAVFGKLSLEGVMVTRTDGSVEAIDVEAVVTLGSPSSITTGRVWSRRCIRMKMRVTTS
jgi:hypothetical protein